MDSFQRNGSPESSTWKTDVDNFQGYMRAKFEDFDKEQKNQWKEHRETKKRVSSLEKRGQYQMGGLAAITALIGIIIAIYAAGLIP